MITIKCHICSKVDCFKDISTHLKVYKLALHKVLDNVISSVDKNAQQILDDVE